MASDLTAKTCLPCQGGTLPLTRKEAAPYLGQMPGWQLDDRATRIVRKFSFGNFVEALVFVSKVGQIAEEQGHHPDIEFGWGYARITLYTHKIGGLHENDFIMAAKIDATAGG